MYVCMYVHYVPYVAIYIYIYVCTYLLYDHVHTENHAGWELRVWDDGPLRPVSRRDVPPDRWLVLRLRHSHLSPTAPEEDEGASYTPQSHQGSQWSKGKCALYTLFLEFLIFKPKIKKGFRRSKIFLAFSLSNPLFSIDLIIYFRHGLQITLNIIIDESSLFWPSGSAYSSKIFKLNFCRVVAHKTVNRKTIASTSVARRTFLRITFGCGYVLHSSLCVRLSCIRLAVLCVYIHIYIQII